MLQKTLSAKRFETGKPGTFATHLVNRERSPRCLVLPPPCGQHAQEGERAISPSVLCSVGVPTRAQSRSPCPITSQTRAIESAGEDTARVARVRTPTLQAISTDSRSFTSGVKFRRCSQKAPATAPEARGTLRSHGPPRRRNSCHRDCHFIPAGKRQEISGKTFQP